MRHKYGTQSVVASEPANSVVDYYSSYSKCNTAMVEGKAKEYSDINPSEVSAYIASK